MSIPLLNMALYLYILNKKFVFRAKDKKAKPILAITNFYSSIITAYIILSLL